MAFFPTLKQNFIAYRSSKVSSRPDCIFEIHQLWQSDFSRVYSNCCCSCSFEPEIMKISQSSHKMYSNNIFNFQVSTTILNACTKKSLETYWRHHVSTSVFDVWPRTSVWCRRTYLPWSSAQWPTGSVQERERKKKEKKKRKFLVTPVCKCYQ